MNGKMKAALAATLALIVAASVVWIVPALARMNGATDQTRDRDRLRERDCTCDYSNYQNQTCANLCLRKCIQNGTNLSCSWQCQYRNQFRHQNTP